MDVKQLKTKTMRDKRFDIRLEFNEKQQAWHHESYYKTYMHEPYTHGWETIFERCTDYKANNFKSYLKSLLNKPYKMSDIKKLAKKYELFEEDLKCGQSLITYDKYDFKIHSEILQWARERGILISDNATKQMLKLSEEVGELAGAIAKGNETDQIDAIGDIQVVLIILSEQLGINYKEALESAYNVIKERKGKTVNGIFIKD